MKLTEDPTFQKLVGQTFPFLGGDIHVISSPRFEEVQVQGEGTRESPLYIDPNDFDEFWKLVERDNQITRVYLHQGIYLTRGCWVFQNYTTCKRPISIIGAGVDKTIIRLSPDACFERASMPCPETNVLWLGLPYATNGSFEVSDLTIDGNESAFDDEHYVTSGLRIWGNKCIIKNIKVINLRGNIHKEFETFGISCLNNASHANPDVDVGGGSIIENCIVINDGKRNNYCSAFYVGYVKGEVDKIAPSTIQNCQAISSNGVSNIGFSFQTATRIRDCYCYGFNYVLYNDTDALTDVIIDGMRADEVNYFALAIHATKQNPPPSKNSVRLVNSTFSFTRHPSKAGLAGIGAVVLTSDADLRADTWTFQDVYVDNCYFDAFTSPEHTFTLVSIASKHLKIVRLYRNIVPLFTKINGSCPSLITSGNLYQNGNPAYSF